MPIMNKEAAVAKLLEHEDAKRMLELVSSEMDEAVSNGNVSAELLVHIDSLDLFCVIASHLGFRMIRKRDGQDEEGYVLVDIGI